MNQEATVKDFAFNVSIEKTLNSVIPFTEADNKCLQKHMVKERNREMLKRLLKEMNKNPYKRYFFESKI